MIIFLHSGACLANLGSAERLPATDQVLLPLCAMTLDGRVDCLRELLVTRSSVPGFDHSGSLGSPNCHRQYRPELLGRLHRGNEALCVASSALCRRAAAAGERYRRGDDREKAYHARGMRFKG